MIRIKYVLIFISLANILYCCNSDRNLFPHRVELIDDTLSVTIKTYISQTSFDKKGSFVSVEYLSDSGVVSYLITAGNSRQGYKMNSPDYFTTIGDVIVLISLTDNKMIAVEGIGNEIDLMATTNGLQLQEELTNFDPPTWVLKRCGGAYNLTTRMQIKYGDYSPCATFNKGANGNIPRIKSK